MRRRASTAELTNEQQRRRDLDKNSTCSTGTCTPTHPRGAARARRARRRRGEERGEFELKVLKSAHNTTTIAHHSFCYLPYIPYFLSQVLVVKTKRLRIQSFHVNKQVRFLFLSGILFGRHYFSALVLQPWPERHPTVHATSILTARLRTMILYPQSHHHHHPLMW